MNGKATDGSSIEIKESALVWHHQEADPDFGTWQAKELLDHLENVLANEPVAVKRGQQIVEVNPQVILWVNFISYAVDMHFRQFYIFYVLWSKYICLYYVMDEVLIGNDKN